MFEYANKKTRGVFIAAVFAMQGFGILVGGILVAIVVSVLFNAGYPSPSFQHNAVASMSRGRSRLARDLNPWGSPCFTNILLADEMPEIARLLSPRRFSPRGYGQRATAWESRGNGWCIWIVYAAESNDPNKTDSGYPPCIGVRNSLIVLGVVLISLECCLHCWYQNLKGNHWRKCQRKMKHQHDDVSNLYLGGIQTSSLFLILLLPVVSLSLVLWFDYHVIRWYYYSLSLLILAWVFHYWISSHT